MKDYVRRLTEDARAWCSAAEVGIVTPYAKQVSYRLMARNYESTCNIVYCFLLIVDI